MARKKPNIISWSSEDYTSHILPKDDIQSLQQKQELDSVHKDIDDLGKNVSVLGAELDKQRTKSLEILAVFVSLFTFISIQLQLLASTNKELAIPLGLIVLGGLLLFSSLLVLSTTVFRTPKFYISAVIVLVSSIILFGSWHSFENYQAKRDVCSTIQEDLINEKDATKQKNLQFVEAFVCK